MALPYTVLNTQMLPTVEQKTWDTVYLADKFTARLRAKARVRAEKWHDIPLRFDLPDLGGWYSGYTTYTLAQSDTITKARYTRCDLVEMYLITDDDDYDASVPEKAVNILVERHRASALALQDRLATAVWGTHSATTVPQGLQDALSTSNPSTSNLGGVDRTDASIGTVWQANVYDKNTDGYGDGTAVQLTPHKLRKIIRTCEGGPNVDAATDSPTVIVTTKAIYSKMLSWPAGIQQITLNYDPKQRPNYSFPAFTFEGIDVIWSQNCVAKWLCILNENFMGMSVYPNADAKVTPLVQVPNGTGLVGQVKWAGHMWYAQPNKLAVLKDVDPDL